MSDDQSPDDKPYDPTPQKLGAARRKGDIVRSADLISAVGHVGFLLAAVLAAGWSADRLGTLMRVLFAQADRLAPQVLAPGGRALAAGLIWPPLVVTIVATAIPALLIILVLTAQRAILFTPENLSFKVSRISPLANARQKFGVQGQFQFLKSTVKVMVVSGLLAIYIMARADRIVALLYADAGQIFLALGRLSFEFMLVVALVSATIGSVDWFWEWSQHQRKNRMTRQEMMDETKSSEGDPYMKQQRRARGMAIAMNKMLADVPKADVVIVNPTHYAVALRWDRGGGAVPLCVAKGVNETALRIRAIAAEAGVPVFSDPPTARNLHAIVELGGFIKPEHFKAVAAAIRFADQMRLKARGLKT